VRKKLQKDKIKGESVELSREEGKYMTGSGGEGQAVREGD